MTQKHCYKKKAELMIPIQNPNTNKFIWMELWKQSQKINSRVWILKQRQQDKLKEWEVVRLLNTEISMAQNLAWKNTNFRAREKFERAVITGTLSHLLKVEIIEILKILAHWKNVITDWTYQWMISSSWSHYKIYNVFIHENCIISFALTFHFVGWKMWKLPRITWNQHRNIKVYFLLVIKRTSFDT